MKSLFSVRAGPLHRAFTLIEMLATISILVILISLVVSGMGPIMEGRRLEDAGRIIVDEIGLARQLAAARNLNVELRFIERKRYATDDTPVFHAIQRGLIDKDGGYAPEGAIASLPEGVIFAPEAALSSMIGSFVKGVNSVPAYSYTSVVIRPSGMIEPRAGLALNVPWFVTAIRERDQGKPADDLVNFVTVQIDPWTSRPVAYRP